MRVVVFGAGYAGLTVARRLERSLPSDVELVVVDETGSHLVQHELHRVIREPSIAGTITLQLSDLLSQATVREASVRDIDPANRTATVVPNGDGDREKEERTAEQLQYDVAAICLGSETEFYDITGLREHAIPLKRIEDAKQIHSDVTETEGTVLVCGGGLSGVQAAGELTALADEHTLDLSVTLLERESRIAPRFDADFSDALRRELTARDVSVHTDTTVAAATDTEIECADGTTYNYDTLVWTGGIRGPSAVAGKRLEADSDLQLTEGTFVVGDTARLTGEDGEPVPASAQTAVREGKIAAQNIRAVVRNQRNANTADTSSATDSAAMDGAAASGDIESEALARYREKSLGWVVSIGDGAVAKVGPVVLNGEPARELKAVIGASHLGSVGEITRAADLVASELGWPTSETVDLLSLGSAHWEEFVDFPTDPATPGEIQTPLFGPAIDLFDAMSPLETVDVTALTGLTERQADGQFSLVDLFSVPAPSETDKDTESSPETDKKKE